jgi:hypothetical protein
MATYVCKDLNKIFEKPYSTKSIKAKSKVIKSNAIKAFR